MGINDIRIINIRQVANGDYLYMLDMDTSTQNRLTKEADKRDMTTEEFIVMCLEEYAGKNLDTNNNSSDKLCNVTKLECSECKPCCEHKEN